MTEHFQSLTLRDEHEGYFLGRGAKAETLARIGVKTWQVLPEEVHEPDFRARYGEHGEHLVDWMLWPLLCPRGRVVGFAGRPYGEKVITRYIAPEGMWVPIWTGLTPETMTRIWEGASIWVVEGIFDLFALEWAVPPQDVVLGSERARLTWQHVEFLRRFARQKNQQVLLVYDNDETGRRGIHGWTDEGGKFRRGALDRLQRVEVEVEVVAYSGKDPGEVWLRGGLSAVRKAFNQRNEST